jgi:thiol:disulfide interchange protein DsbG
MTKFKYSFAFFALASTFSAFAAPASQATGAPLATVAATTPAAAASSVPPALAMAMKAGVRIEKVFPALSGLTGYVLNKNGEFSIVYATPDNQTLINGMVISAEGQNMAQVYEDLHTPKPALDALWGSLENAAVISTGAKGAAVKSVAYAFLDPNCIYCNFAWKAFKPYEKAGLQVRWIPVAFLNATSSAKAAALLQATDPAAALDQHETNYKAGGISIQGFVAKPETRAKVEANGKLMRDFGFNGTPAMVYKDPKTGKVLAKNGMPKLSELPTMFGLPAIANTDPELAKFE